MGRAPLDLAAPEIADRLDLPVEIIEDWVDRRLLVRVAPRRGAP